MPNEWGLMPIQLQLRWLEQRMESQNDIESIPKYFQLVQLGIRGVLLKCKLSPGGEGFEDVF